ncbi:MAG: fumarylacetoacetase [Gemmatimonadales bacterium]|nr:MAG: fumarylacetoacetase [Gemmatimonadales bacterium]
MSDDPTLDPARRSWIPSANEPGTDFPVQNLPFGAFRREPGDEQVLGVAIGDRVLDLRAALRGDALNQLPTAILEATGASTLNPLLALGKEAWKALREAVSAVLTEGTRHEPPVEGWVPAQAEVTSVLPITVGDYTYFYASIHHATNVGRMFRPENPLLPNYKHVPIGYHGRASSIVVSGTPVTRPSGQRKAADEDGPTFGPCRLLDYECEVGFVIGPGNRLGETIAIANASDHIFGYCLLNDWSARDIQAWEYQPLGPFLAKSFATTLSPWIITGEALPPFRSMLAPRPSGDPVPLPYLDDLGVPAGIDLHLEVHLQTRTMREAGSMPHRLSRANFLDMYWSPEQMLTHHTSNGCNLRPGDLLGSGTVSGPADDARGCLLELTSRGSRPVTLPNEEVRRFLQDGDEVILTGRCDREGFTSIGFGECRGRVVG